MKLINRKSILTTALLILSNTTVTIDEQLCNIWFNTSLATQITLGSAGFLYGITYFASCCYSSTYDLDQEGDAIPTQCQKCNEKIIKVFDNQKKFKAVACCLVPLVLVNTASLIAAHIFCTYHR